MNVYIHEKSFIARIAAYKLGATNCAIVIGSTIHLHNTSKQELLNNKAWLRHEVCHVRQWKQKGYLLFLIHYLYLSVLKGYHQNPYEAEAREAEENPAMMNSVQVL